MEDSNDRIDEEDTGSGCATVLSNEEALETSGAAYGFFGSAGPGRYAVRLELRVAESQRFPSCDLCEYMGFDGRRNET